jgi:hypothetical protein
MNGIDWSTGGGDGEFPAFRVDLPPAEFVDYMNTLHSTPRMINEVKKPIFFPGPKGITKRVFFQLRWTLPHYAEFTRWYFQDELLL